MVDARNAQANFAAQRWVARGLLTLTLLFLWTPLVNRVLNIVTPLPPAGMALAKHEPLTVDGFLGGAAQRALSRSALERSGWWKPLTIFQNQLLYTFFSQLGPFHNSGFIVGRDDQLIQTEYLPAVQRRSDKIAKRTFERLLRLKALQERQRQKGKAVLLLVSPDFVTLYPEVVPSRYRDESKSAASYRSRVVEIAKQLEIPYVDGNEVLHALARALSVERQHLLAKVRSQRLFGRGGSHPNDLGSCELLLHLSRLLEGAVGGTVAAPLPLPILRRFDCDEWHLEYPPRERDRNLVDLSNLFDISPFLHPMPYVDVAPPAVLSGQQPSVLLVGSSHLDGIEAHLSDWKLVSSVAHLFYFLEYRRGGQAEYAVKDLKELPWKEYLDSDVIIFDLLARSPDRLGHGFLEGALRYLRKVEEAHG